MDISVASVTKNYEVKINYYHRRRKKIQRKIVDNILFSTLTQILSLNWMKYMCPAL